MWPLIYLSLLNIGLGFFAALVVYCRVRYVRRQMECGYDLKRLSPPSRLRNFLRRCGARVKVDTVCLRLGETPPTPPPREPAVTEMSETASQTAEVTTLLDSSESETTPVANLSDSAAENDRDAKELDPLSRPETITQDLLPRPELEPREVRYLEPLAAKYGGESTATSVTNRRNASVTELSAKPESANRADVDSRSGPSPAKPSKSSVHETSNATAKEVVTLPLIKPESAAVVTELKSDAQTTIGRESTSEEGRKKFAAQVTREDDFLQRAAHIDRLLRAVMENHDLDSEATLQEIIADVEGTHQWWTEFEGSVSKALKTKAPAQTPREQRAQIDDDLVAMQACLVECHSLIESTATGKQAQPTSNNNQSLPTPEFPREMHNCMIQATKACHRLRDNLALMISDSPLRFSESTGSQFAGRPPLSYVAEIGLQGVEAVVSQWEVEMARGNAATASLVLIDVDRTSHWNNELGLESVDRILTVCHRQLAESVRSNRGFDRVIRISGQQFLVFLGSTDSKQAKFAAERLRQIFANTTWRESGQALVIQVSAAVVSYDAHQPIGAQITQLRAGLPEAKRLGGNSVVERSLGGRFQKITGVPKYPLPARHHDQPLEKWKPNASVTC
ncbi:MAG: diguanylate cyclase [Planctomycetaceae bacterium]|nr:diguanylate cyclase [Planctomycetaceae bacterium]